MPVAISRGPTRLPEPGDVVVEGDTMDSPFCVWIARARYQRTADVRTRMLLWSADIGRAVREALVARETAGHRVWLRTRHPDEWAEIAPRQR
jgi:hypothetical protein